MTKLEEKLIELGYQYYNDDFAKITTWYKHMNDCDIKIQIDYVSEQIIYTNIQYWTSVFSNQYQIDNLQQAFNQLQKDLEVLKNDNNL